MENKKVENQNIESIKEYYEGLLAMQQGHIYWKNLKSEYQGCNDLQATDAGLQSREQIIGMTDYDMPWHEDADFLRQVDQEVIRTQKSIVVEERSKTASGKNAIWLTKKAPHYDKDGNVIGIVGTSIDITELKEAQEKANKAITEAALLEANAKAEETLRNVVTTYADAIAHNLRTPLLGIKFVCEFYQKLTPTIIKLLTEHDPENKILSRRELKMLLENPALRGMSEILQINKMIDNNLDTLNLAIKIHLGKATKDDLMECDYADNINQLPFNAAMVDKDPRILHINATHTFKYLGNVVAMEQIHTVLLENAIYQINKCGKGEIYISTEDGVDMNLVKFRDTATGASADIVAHMFDSHFTTKAEGHGVGLAFCKNVMQLFGGDITANSVEGEYMEFVLSFPKMNAEPRP